MRVHDIKKNVNPKSILDIGANVGQFATMIAKVFPEATIECVEGNIECTKLLKELDFVKAVHENYLSDTVKTVPFYKRKEYPTATGNSMYKELTPFYSPVELEVEHVTTSTLNELFSTEQSFDLIKIDTQGSELDILKGGKELVSKAKAVLLEVAVEVYNEGAPFYRDVDKYMKQEGFTESEVVAENIHPLSSTVVQYDVLYYKK